MERRNLELRNVAVCNPFEEILSTNITIKDGLVHSICQEASSEWFVDLSGYCLYPGFINSHDHLLGTYLPRVGNGPYLNWKPWDQDLKASAVYKERYKISNRLLYMLGGYRQILGGVTTVSDHIPHSVNNEYIKESFIRILKNYALSHEFTSYDLCWGESSQVEIAKSKKEDIVFLTHMEEGFDQEAMESLLRLEKEGGLYKNTVLVHCVACDDHDIARIAKSGASVVWCPSSNWFMFQKTMDVRKMLQEGVNVCLGTDSPMSGGVNLLEELRFAAVLYKKLYQESLSEKILLQMVTHNAAKAFKIEKNLGSIAVGKKADFVMVKKSSLENSYQALLKISVQDIVWVVSGGQTLLVAEEWSDLLKIDKRLYQLVCLDKFSKSRYFLIGTPLDVKNSINRSLGYSKNLDFFPVEALL